MADVHAHAHVVEPLRAVAASGEDGAAFVERMLAASHAGWGDDPPRGTLALLDLRRRLAG